MGRKFFRWFQMHVCCADGPLDDFWVSFFCALAVKWLHFVVTCLACTPVKFDLLLVCKYIRSVGWKAVDLRIGNKMQRIAKKHKRSTTVWREKSEKNAAEHFPILSVQGAAFCLYTQTHTHLVCVGKCILHKSGNHKILSSQQLTILQMNTGTYFEKTLHKRSHH